MNCIMETVSELGHRCVVVNVGRGWRIGIPILVFIVALGVSIPILNAPFTGQDELMVLSRVQQANCALGALDIRTLANVFLYDFNPPGRTLIAMPFVWLLGPTGVALRFPNWILWGLVCACASVLGSILGGKRTGMVTGLLLAGSGLFDVFGMGHGHAGEALFVLGLLSVLTCMDPLDVCSAGGRRVYVAGGVLIATGFLFFTSLLPVAAFYHSICLMRSLWGSPDRKHVLARYARVSAPFILFYVLYYLYFLGLPMILSKAPFGQWHQNVLRGSLASPNVHSLGENIRALNWYVLPWIPIVFLLSGMWEMSQRNRAGFWTTLPFGLLFCFYIRGMTGAHFFSYFCWTLPFAISGIDRALTNHWRPSRTYLLWIVLIALVGGWGYIGHIRSYSADTYPIRLLMWSRGQVYWQNNLT